ncbi:Uncharacterized protein OBRU01_10459 [Operophtera brumata]|uniref:FLYWCH-type domain-containing protein n=1 Tax=Operophtera brumata TaxID=104452 RepID=A0A0L7LD75_OPEBR|nr:Uncharacterized protein OBRU01_10459 [Operophtera brumata]
MLSFPAEAFMASLLRARYLRERQTTSILIGGFKFFRHSRSMVGNRIRWTCAKKHKHKCKVSAVTIDVRYVNKHNGKQVAILNGYTFGVQNTYKNTLFWQCTMGNAKCKARLVTTVSVIYVQRLNGNQLAILNGYTFSIQNKYPNSLSWQCTLGNAKCKARFVTTISVIYVKKPNGNRLAILDGYTFCFHSKYRKTVHWRCTMGYNKCKANVVTNADDDDLKIANNEHTHPPPTYTIASGKILAIHHGYTFYCSRENKHTKTWQCTAWGKCKSKFTMLLDSVVKTIEAQHTHPPPGYKIINDIFYKF